MVGDVKNLRGKPAHDSTALNAKLVNYPNVAAIMCFLTSISLTPTHSRMYNRRRSQRFIKVNEIKELKIAAEREQIMD
jgi:hypothetical protein